MTANSSRGPPGPANGSEGALPAGLQLSGPLELTFTVLSAVMVGLLMFSLGCSVEAQKLWAHLRRPWGIVVGLLCQFGLMPLTAYLLALGFSLPPLHAVAVLVMGCCPGGTISNIFTFWTDGDMDLSISMTTCSTVAALGMMPLCLYLYSWSWSLEHSLTIPYHSIGITLVCLIVPVVFGVYVNYKWPKQSKIILKIGAAAGGALLLSVAVAGVVLARGSLQSDVTLLIISFIFPLIGHAAGFLLALLAHQSWQRCRTISLETGAQNIQLCITMLQLSFATEQLIQMLSFPLAYGLFQLLDGFLLVAVYQAYKRRQKSKVKRSRKSVCEEAYHEKSSSPQETSAFLEVAEGAEGTPGAQTLKELWRTPSPGDCPLSMASKDSAELRSESC